MLYITRVVPVPAIKWRTYAIFLSLASLPQAGTPDEPWGSSPSPVDKGLPGQVHAVPGHGSAANR